MPLPRGSHNPIFPQPLTERGQLDYRPATQRGLSLLDHLAIEALAVAQRRLESLEASYLNCPPVRHQGSAAQVAAEAYDLAEAMLSERQKRHNAAEAVPQA